jgi:hypothetical protein
LAKAKAAAHLQALDHQLCRRDAVRRGCCCRVLASSSCLTTGGCQLGQQVLQWWQQQHQNQQQQQGSVLFWTCNDCVSDGPLPACGLGQDPPIVRALGPTSQPAASLDPHTVCLSAPFVCLSPTKEALGTDPTHLQLLSLLHCKVQLEGGSLTRTSSTGCTDATCNNDSQHGSSRSAAAACCRHAKGSEAPVPQRSQHVTRDGPHGMAHMVWSTRPTTGVDSCLRLPVVCTAAAAAVCLAPLFPADE